MGAFAHRCRESKSDPPFFPRADRWGPAVPICRPTAALSKPATVLAALVSRPRRHPGRVGRDMPIEPPLEQLLYNLRACAYLATDRLVAAVAAFLEVGVVQ